MNIFSFVFGNYYEFLIQSKQHADICVFCFLCFSIAFLSHIGYTGSESGKSLVLQV